MIFPGIIGYRLSLSRALAATGQVELILLTDAQDEITGDDSGYRSIVTFRLAGRRLSGPLARRLGIRKVANIYFGISSVLRSVVMCKQGHPKLIHVQGLVYAEALCVLCIAALKAIGFQVVFTPHDAGPRSSSPATNLMWRIMLKLSDRVVVHSNAAAARIKIAYATPPHKIDVMPFANYDVAAIAHQGLDRNRAREMLGLPRDARVLLFFGLVRPYKGLEFLVQALPYVAARIPDVRLMVIGQALDGFGSYDRMIHSLGLEGRTVIRTESYIEVREHAKYFLAADLVILPYRDLPEIDGSAVVAEALSFGRAVIASDVGGIREQVIDGVTGLKVPPEQVDSLAMAICDLLLDEGRRRGMERAALQRAKELTWDMAAMQTIATYEKVLRDSGAAEPGG